MTEAVSDKDIMVEGLCSQAGHPKISRGDLQVKKKRADKLSRKGDSPKGKRFIYPKPDKPPIRVRRSSSPDGKMNIEVDSKFVTMACSYHPEELKEWLIDHVKTLLIVGFRGTDPKDSEENLRLQMEEAYVAPLQGLDPEMQELVLVYGNFSYETFTEMILSKMYQLPELLVEQIHYKIISVLDEKGHVPFKVKAGARRMWDDLVNEMGKVLKEEWLNLKPGPKEVTSKIERAGMLAFYKAQLGMCQSAKVLYRQIHSQDRRRNWRVKIKERHPELDDVVIDNVPDHKASELAILGTGKYFKKIIGRDFRGAEEVKRQLGIARKEATEEAHDQ